MKKIILLFLTILFSGGNAFAQTAEFLACIETLIKSSPDSLTLGEMKAKCTPQRTETEQPEGPVSERIAIAKSNINRPFTLLSHRPNYLLPFSYNASGWNSSLYRNTNGEEQLDLEKAEVQFQLSIKMPLTLDILGTDIDAYGAYTMRSFWQAFNNENSAPFRETNHEPEIWLQRDSKLRFGPLKNVLNGIGFVHQSNGQGGRLSRSWNRAYAFLGFEIGNFGFIIKPWLRISEDENQDNNPNITDYLGHGEILCAYERDGHTFSLMSRNNLESGFSNGAVQLSWSFPLFNYDYFRGYAQFFHGYGESMIDYDRSINRIAVGLLLTEVL